MCSDVPGQPPLKRIAVCACNASFPECDTEDAKKHINMDTSPNHYWVWLDADWEEEIMEHHRARTIREAHA